MKTFGCLVCNPDNALLHRTDLEACYKDNNHGTGIYVWDKIEKKHLVIKFEPFADFNKIWEQIEKFNTQPDRYCNLVINLRYATLGRKTKNHTQPIAVFEDQMYLVHHGTYLEFEWKPEYMSDTQCMAAWIQNYLLQNEIDNIDALIKNPMIIELLEDKFTGNKVLLVEKDKYVMLNKDIWFQDVDGVWWSQPR